MKSTLAVIAFLLLVQSASPAVDFQRQIRPILSENCFLCHGPDQGTRMANLRLDTHDGVMAPRKDGTPIVPGKPDESLIIKRVFADRPAMRMPPPQAHRTLTAAQKDLLKTWIAEGAQWKDHWAFIAPVKASLPSVKAAAWPRNPIDNFILAKLEANGLQPAPEADRRTLIRRVTLDLTGLPPAPNEVDAFVKDKSPTAYEKIVDRLLASPRWGEHRGRYWLDAARYADTQGLHIDSYREMWPYRDWVIAAFNRNMPFDKFTVEQLAGDLLPNATLDQKIASGFQRCNVTTNEGGAIPDEVAAIYAKDRADTTGAVWMGLTVGCATCHDHKFDPIRQKEFYALTAFYRNTTQRPLDGNIPDTPPTVIVPLAQDRARWDELNRQRSALLDAVESAKAEGKTGAVSKPWSDAALAFDMDPASVSLSEGVTLGTGIDDPGKALHFADKSFVTLPHTAAIDSDKPFTIATWVYLPKGKDSWVVASQYEPEPPDASKDNHDRRRGWRIEMSKRGPYFKMTGADAQFLSAGTGPDTELKQEAWYHVAFTYDGSRDRKGLRLYLNGEFVPTFGNGEDFHPLLTSVANDVPLLLGRDRKNYFPDGAIAEFKILNEMVDAEQAKLLSLWNKVSSPEPDHDALATYNALANTQAGRELEKIDIERDALARRGAITFVMQERADTKPIAHVLNRGLYDQPKEEVTPDVPAVLPPMSASYPRNRLGLAEWLVDPTNPLTARVTVNRFWQEVFGTGIVKTVEDFGSQGEPASHPELLDWLAVDFRENGWNVKSFFRLIVTSATYKQAAVSTADKIAKDPDNRLLSRGARFRMDGEMVRDYALAVSGLLTPTIGGPSVKPYQPANVWETVAMNESNTKSYRADSGDKLYRRSMYTFWKRSAPPASMDIFNAPSREVCTVRRERTNTPLQALVTMNDPQFVEAARTLAQNALESSKGHADRGFDYMASHLLGRAFDPNEQQIVAKSYHDYLNYYDSKPQDATKLLAVGESKSNPKLSKAEFAAMTMVANELLNLDEVLTK